ncbi:hypothetical protein BH09MYX1_BH09MYX1_65340 [soil metagenome]
MSESTNPLLPEVDVPTIERREIGNVVQIAIRGIVVYQFDNMDSTGRDVAIASLMRLGLATDRIASLCGASHGWVCRVRKRLRAGGLEEVVAKRRSGRPRTIQGAMRTTLVRMMAEGEKCARIARALGVAGSVVHDEMARIRAQREQLSIIHGASKDPAPTTGGVEARSETVVDADEGAPADDDAPASAGMSEVATEVVGEPIAQPEAESAEKLLTSDGSRRDDDPSREDTLQEPTERCGDLADETVPVPVRDEDLAPGAQLPSGPVEHPTRYAGVLLATGALAAIGIQQALAASGVARPKAAIYEATTALFAMMAGWSAGFPSLESMHERDARALGVVLGLERSPSVRTLHRAIQQMCATFDASAFTAAWMRALGAATLPDRLCFGIDGHFKPYAGDAPIDKGWDSKRRLATKGIADVAITDERGWTWSSTHVGAGDALSSHVLAEAQLLRAEFGDARPIVLAFDRGGFAFDALDALDAEGFGYVTYVPRTVTLPPLATVARDRDLVGEIAWNHPKLHHRARLLVERDGDDLIPIATNITTLVDASDVVDLLRACRGAQENAFKAARAHAHIDRLVDRGGATHVPDDRPISNPERTRLKTEVASWQRRESELAAERAINDGRTQKEINRDRFRVGAERQLAEIKLKNTPARVPRVSVDPKAERATLDTTNRVLLQPMKLATDNARRWLLATLHDGLVPTDNPYDADTAARTLDALLHAPGTVRFDDDAVHVTLDLPLAPTAHSRLDAALRAIVDRHFRFTGGGRRLVVRLAPRPTRRTLPHLLSTAN